MHPLSLLRLGRSGWDFLCSACAVLSHPPLGDIHATHTLILVATHITRRAHPSTMQQSLDTEETKVDWSRACFGDVEQHTFTTVQLFPLIGVTMCG